MELKFVSEFGETIDSVSEDRIILEYITTVKLIEFFLYILDLT